MLSLLLAVAIHAQAASKPAPATQITSRSLTDLLAVVMDQGASRTLKREVTAPLDLAETVATKAIRYKETVTPDGKEHTFYVLLSSESKPTGFIANVASRKMVDGGKFLQGRDFHGSLSGKLLHAVEFSGLVGKVASTKLKSADPEIAKDFKKEMDFFLKDSVRLHLEMSGK